MPPSKRADTLPDPNLPSPGDAPWPSGSLPPGAYLGGRYQIVRRIGGGGFGEVYLAEDDQVHRRRCAIKRLVLDAQWDAATRELVREAFVREGRLLAQINQNYRPPHIPDIYDVLERDGCLVMKYIEGRSLRDMLEAQPGGVAEREALRIARDVAKAIAYLHAHGPEPLIHRDIKPANILLDEGSPPEVWVLDFGLGKLAPMAPPEASPDRTLFAGTPGFAAPEQWKGLAGPPADVYALGATLCAMLTGAPPGQASLPTMLTRGVAQLIEQMIAPQPEGRPTARACLEALEQLIALSELPPPPVPEQPPITDALVGRGEALAACRDLLGRERMVVITGMAGVGKTTLASNLARRVAGGRPVCWHSFPPDQQPADAAHGMLWSIGGFLAHHSYPELWRLLQRGQQPGQTIYEPSMLFGVAFDRLRAGGYLLCLDDLPATGAGTALGQFVAQLRAVGLPAIITAQRARRFGFGSLPQPFVLEGLSSHAIAELFAARGVRLSAADLALLQERTEGNPQFLHLAAEAIAQGGDPEALLAGLADATRVREYLLLAVHERLDEAERRLMEGFSALLGMPATADAIGEILDMRAADPIDQLLGRHLLRARPGATGLEYDQHGLLRTFYYARLRRSERLALHRRAATYYERDEPHSLRAALHYEHANEYEQAAALATADVWLSLNSGHARQLAALLERLARRPLPPASLPPLLIAQGTASTLLRDGPRATAAYQEALRQLSAVADPAQRARLEAAICRGMAELREPVAPNEARRWLDRGITTLEAAPAEHHERALLYLRLSSIHLALGAPDDAAAAASAVLELLASAPSRWRAGAVMNLGVCAGMAGDLAAAAAHFHEARQLYAAVGDQWGLAAAQHNIGMTLDYGGDWAAAANAYAEALALARPVGDVQRETVLELALGTLAMQRGHDAEAREHLERAADLADRYGLREYQVASAASLAQLAIHERQWDAAAAQLDRAERTLAVLDVDDQRAEIARARALVALHRADLALAASAAADALAAARAHGDDRERGLCRRVQAEVLAAQGQFTEAAAEFRASYRQLREADPYEAARTQLLWGQALVAHGEGAAGRRRIKMSAQRFAELGAERELAAARAALHSDQVVSMR